VIRKLHEKILYALNFVDITIPVYPEELWKQPGGKREDSATDFERVKRCVNFLSKDRNSNEFPGKLGISSLDYLRKKMNKSAEELLNAWEKKENPGINGVLRALRIALTIALMEGSDYITAPHIAEAVQYRMVRFDLV
jgi:predicted ATPase with chaperone activity